MHPLGHNSLKKMGFLLTRWSIFFDFQTSLLYSFPHSKNMWVPESRHGSHHQIIWISCIGLSVYHLHLSNSLFLASLSQLSLDLGIPIHTTISLIFSLQSLCFLVNDNYFQMNKIGMVYLNNFCIFSTSFQHSLLEESNVS